MVKKKKNKKQQQSSPSAAGLASSNIFPPRGTVSKPIIFSAACFSSDAVPVDTSVVVTYCTEKIGSGNTNSNSNNKSKKKDESSSTELIVHHTERHDLSTNSPNTSKNTVINIGNVPMKMVVYSGEVEVKLHKDMVTYYHYEAMDCTDDGNILEQVAKIIGSKKRTIIYKEDCLRTLHHVKYYTVENQQQRTHRQEDLVVFWNFEDVNSGPMPAVDMQKLWLQALLIRMQKFIFGGDLSVSKCNELLRTGNGMESYFVWGQQQPQQKFLKRVKILANNVEAIHNDFVEYTQYRHYLFCAKFDSSGCVIDIEVVPRSSMEGNISHLTHDRLKRDDLSLLLFNVLFFATSPKHDLSARLLVILSACPQILLNKTMTSPSNLNGRILADIKTLFENVLGGREGNKFREWVKKRSSNLSLLHPLLHSLKTNFGGWKGDISYGWIRAFLLFRAMGGTIVYQNHDRGLNIKHSPIRAVVKKILQNCYLYHFIPIDNWDEDTLMRLKDARPTLLKFLREECAWNILADRESDCIDPIYIKRAIRNMLIGSSDSVDMMLVYSKNDIALMLEWVMIKIVSTGGSETGIFFGPGTIRAVTNAVSEILVNNEVQTSAPMKEVVQTKKFFQEVSYMKFEGSFAVLMQLYSAAEYRYDNRFTTNDIKKSFLRIVNDELRKTTANNLLDEDEDEDKEIETNNDSEDQNLLDIDNYDEGAKRKSKKHEKGRKKKNISKCSKRITSHHIFKYSAMKNMLDSTNDAGTGAMALKDCFQKMIVEACRSDLNGVLERFFELKWDGSIRTLEGIWTRGMEMAASERSDALHTFVDVVVKYNTKHDKVRIMRKVLDTIVDDVVMSVEASQNDDDIESMLLSPLQCPIFHTLIDLYAEFSDGSRKKISKTSKIFAKLAEALSCRQVDVSLLRKGGLLDEHRDRFVGIIDRIRSSADSETKGIIPKSFDRTNIEECLQECEKISMDLDLIDTAKTCIVNLDGLVVSIVEWESSFHENFGGNTLFHFQELHKGKMFQTRLEHCNQKFLTIAQKLRSGQITFGEIQNVNLFEDERLQDYVKERYDTESQTLPDFVSRLKIVQLYAKIKNMNDEKKKLYDRIITTFLCFLQKVIINSNVNKCEDMESGEIDMETSEFDATDILSVELDFLKLLPSDCDDSILNCQLLLLTENSTQSWALLVLRMLDSSTENPIVLEKYLEFLSTASTVSSNLVQWWTKNFSEPGDIEKFADVCRATSLGESDLDTDRLRGLELLSPVIEPIVIFKTTKLHIGELSESSASMLQFLERYTEKSTLKCFCGQEIGGLLSDVFEQINLSPSNLSEKLETYSEDMAWLEYIVSNQNSAGTGVGETIKDIDTNGRFVVPRSGGDMMVDWPTDANRPALNAETLKNINDRSVLLTAKTDSTDRFTHLYGEVQQLNDVMIKLNAKGVPLLSNVEVKIISSSVVEVDLGLQHHILVEHGRESYSAVYIVRDLRRKFEVLMKQWDEEMLKYQKKNMILNKMSETEIIRIMKLMCSHDAVSGRAKPIPMEKDDDDNDNVIVIDDDSDEDDGDGEIHEYIEAKLCFDYLVCDEDFELDPEIEEVLELKHCIQSARQYTLPQRSPTCYPQDEPLVGMLTSLGWDLERAKLQLDDVDRNSLFMTLFQSKSSLNEKEDFGISNINQDASTASDTLERVWDLFLAVWNDAGVLFVAKQVGFSGGVSLKLLDRLFKSDTRSTSVDSIMGDIMNNTDVEMTPSAMNTTKLNIPTNAIIINMDCENPILLVLKLLCTQAKNKTKADDVLFCSSETTARDIERFVDRVFLYSDESTKASTSLFYLVNVENLWLGVAEESVLFIRRRIHTSTMCDNPHKLCIICSSDRKDSAYMSVAFAKDSFEPPPSILMNDDSNSKSICLHEHCEAASRTLVITSEKSGGGKTWFWKQEMKQTNVITMDDMCVIPLWESCINESELCKRLLDFTKERMIKNKGKQWSVRLILIVKPQIRFDNLDEILFKISVLGILRSSDGRRWRFTNNCSVRIECSDTESSAVIPYLRRQHISSPQELLDLSTAQLLDDESRQWQCAFIVDNKNDFPYVAEHLGGDHRTALKNIDRVIKMKAILKICMNALGTTNPTWRRLYEFIKGAKIFLGACEQSIFVREITGMKKFVIEHTVVQMVRDFLSPMNDTVLGDQKRRRWESAPQPYLMFNDDMTTLSFIGFHVDMKNNTLSDDKGQVIKQNVFTNELKNELNQYIQYGQLDLNENFGDLRREEKLKKLCRIFGVPESGCNVYDPNPDYDLTTDNCQKMLAMHVRFLCCHPVVMEGETGIGKTELARFYAKLRNGAGEEDDFQNSFIEVKVHGGTTKEDIKRHVSEADKHSRTHHTILFFDECNTSHAALQLCSEIMMDGTCDGRVVPAIKYGLKCVMACNPYRKHTQQQIERLEHAGLKQQNRSKTVMEDNIAHLVYRVFPLPNNITDIVYDFGSLRPESEKQYIKLLVERRLDKDPLKSCIADRLHKYQNYMRLLNNEKAFVSLRDVKRCLDVYEFFLLQLCNDKNTMVLRRLVLEQIKKDSPGSIAIPDLRLIAWHGALGVAYHLSLEKNNRLTFSEMVNGESGSGDDLELNLKLLMTIFMVEAQSVLDRQQSIAQNTALTENVFLMAVCTQLRIPLFIVGKPGTSKSLAKSIIGDVMKGTASKSSLYRQLKRAKHITYQCSHLSTAEGILNTFKECSKQQHEKNIESKENEQQDDGFVAVAVLDEIGLAEASDTMPLKALHPLLETGCSPRGIIEVKPNKTDKVGVIAISNWPLDPAKMNRGICVCREELTRAELEFTALKIIGNNLLPQKTLKNICHSFTEIMKQQGMPEIFGLRDFYAFLKMINVELLNTRKTQEECLLYSIERNFSSCSLSSVDAIGILKTNLDLSHNVTSFDRLELLRDNLNGSDGIDTRYPLLVPGGNISDMLHLLEHSNVISSHSPQQCNNSSAMKIMFGSPYAEDRSYYRTCRMINELKLALETGQRVILLNCSNIYESIYDVLNQFYVRCHGNKYVDIGLGSHRAKCRVHENAKIVIVARAEEVLEQLPIPLINRLEKHEISLENGLPNELKIVAQKVRDFAEGVAGDDTIEYAFVGYGKETPFVLIAKAQFMLQTKINLDSGMNDVDKNNVQVESKAKIVPSQKRRKTNSHDPFDRILRTSQTNRVDMMIPESFGNELCEERVTEVDDFFDKDNMEVDNVDLLGFEELTKEDSNQDFIMLQSLDNTNYNDNDTEVEDVDMPEISLHELHSITDPIIPEIATLESEMELKQLATNMLLNRALPSSVVKYCYDGNGNKSFLEQYFRSRDLKGVLRCAFSTNNGPNLLLVTTYSPPLTRDDFICDENMDGYLADIIPKYWTNKGKCVQLFFISDVKSQVELEERVKSMPKEGGLLVIQKTPDSDLALASTINLLECTQYCIQNSVVGISNFHVLFILQLPKKHEDKGLKQPHSFVTHSTGWQCDHLDTLFSSSDKDTGILPPMYRMWEVGQSVFSLLDRIKKIGITDGNVKLLVKFFRAIVIPSIDFGEMMGIGLGDRLWLVESLRRQTIFVDDDDDPSRSDPERAALVNCLSFCLNCMLTMARDAEAIIPAPHHGSSIEKQKGTTQRSWFHEQSLSFPRNGSFAGFIEQQFLDTASSLLTIVLAYHNRYKNFEHVFDNKNNFSSSGFPEWCSLCAQVVTSSKVKNISNQVSETSNYSTIIHRIVHSSEQVSSLVTLPVFNVHGKKVASHFEAGFPFFVGFYSILDNTLNQIKDFYGKDFYSMGINIIQKQILIKLPELQQIYCANQSLPFSTRESLRQKYTIDLIGCTFASRTTKKTRNLCAFYIAELAQVLNGVHGDQNQLTFSSDEVEHSPASILEDIITVHLFFHKYISEVYHIVEVCEGLAKMRSQPFLVNNVDLHPSFKALKQKYHLEFMQTLLEIILENGSSIESEIQSVLNAIEIYLSVENDGTNENNESYRYLQRIKICQIILSHGANDLISENTSILREIEPPSKLLGFEMICHILSSKGRRREKDTSFHLFVAILSNTDSELESDLASNLALWAAGFPPLVRFGDATDEKCRRFLAQLLVHHGYFDQFVEACNTAVNTYDRFSCAAMVYIPLKERMLGEQYDRSMFAPKRPEVDNLKTFRQSIEQFERITNSLTTTMTAVQIMDAVASIRVAICNVIYSHFERKVVQDTNVDGFLFEATPLFKMIEIVKHKFAMDHHHLLVFCCRAVHKTYGFEKLQQFVQDFPSVLPPNYEKLLSGDNGQHDGDESDKFHTKKHLNMYAVRKERHKVVEGDDCNGKLYCDWVYYFNLLALGLQTREDTTRPPIVTIDDQILAILAGTTEAIFDNSIAYNETRILNLSEVTGNDLEFASIVERIRKFHTRILKKVPKEEQSIFKMLTQLLVHFLVQIRFTAVEKSSNSNQRLVTHPLLTEFINLAGVQNGAKLNDRIKQLFLPGMPQNIEEQIDRLKGQAHITQWYACTNCGEKYGVGDCGALNSTSRCASCNHLIGRTNHQRTNPATMSSDQWRGHILNDPIEADRFDRGALRVQNGAHQSILLAILHTSLCLGEIAECQNDMFAKAEEWMKHLKRDTDDLQRCLNLQSVEDAGIILHRIVGRVLADIRLDEQGERRELRNVMTAIDWSSTQNCAAWETAFIELISNESMNHITVEEDRQKILDHTKDDSIELLMRMISVPKVNSAPYTNILSTAVTGFIASFTNKVPSSNNTLLQGILEQFVVDPVVWQASESFGTLKHFRNAFADYSREQKRTGTLPCAFLSEIFDRVKCEGVEVFSYLSLLSVILNNRWKLQIMIEKNDFCTLTFEEFEKTIGKENMILILDCIAALVPNDQGEAMTPQDDIREYFGTHGKLDAAIDKLVRIQNAIVTTNSNDAPKVFLTPDRWHGMHNQERLKRHIVHINIRTDFLPTLAAYCTATESYDFLQINNALYNRHVTGKAEMRWEKTSEDQKSTVFRHFNAAGLRKSCDLLSSKEYSKLLPGIRTFSRTTVDIDQDIECLNVAARLILGTKYDRDFLANEEVYSSTSNISLLQFLEDNIEDVSEPLRDFLTDMDFLVPSDSVFLQSLLRVARSIDAFCADRSPFMKDNRFSCGIICSKCNLSSNSHTKSSPTNAKEHASAVASFFDLSKIAKDSADVVYWSCALHYLLLFWTRQENERSMKDSKSDFQNGFRFPNPQYPLVNFLDFAGFEDFPDEDVTANETISLFFDLVGRIPGWKRT